MVIIMIGGLVLAAAGVVGGLLAWGRDGYGPSTTRVDYDSRRPHPSDAPSGRD